MPVAIETVIIIIVVVSFAVLSAVLFALYWLWRLLQEDRRCRRHSEWPTYVGRIEDGTQRALLGSRRNNPGIIRRQEVCVDERSRRKVKRSGTTTTGMQTAPSTNTRSSSLVPNTLPSTLAASIHPQSLEVIVLDGTEPPPPYEAIAR